jgi:hypothetical protein
MSRPTEPAKKPKPGFSVSMVTMPGLYLLVFASCGWLILMANMFGIAGRSGWIFPVVDDIAGLAGSTVFLALIGLTPLALRQVFFSKKGEADK